MELALKYRVIKISTTSIILAIFLIVLSPVISFGFANIGGYISEKLVGDGTNYVLNVGDGTNFFQMVGSAPVVTTHAATSTAAGGTLHGTLNTMNGMPTASVWFVWGYSAATMTNTTTPSTVTGIGNLSANINALAGKEVFYQFRSSTDGIAYGAVSSFIAGGSRGSSYWFIKVVLPIIVAAGILVGILVLTGNPFAAIIGGIIGLVGFSIIQALLSTF